MTFGQTFSLCPSNLNHVFTNMLEGHTGGIRDLSCQAEEECELDFSFPNCGSKHWASKHKELPGCCLLLCVMLTRP